MDDRVESPVPMDPRPSKERSVYMRAALLPSLSDDEDTAPFPPPADRRQPLRQARRHFRQEQEEEEREEEEREEEETRPISPSDLPGVQVVPKELNAAIEHQLVPGEYFAKSLTRYLGPFDVEPTSLDLPQDDNYAILQRMGRLPTTGKSIFRHVRSLVT